jgi:hypothetical protein
LRLPFIRPAGLLLCLPVAAWAQNQSSGGPLQVHGFFTQGYALSDHNNYLTMNTSRGTAQMTDGGLNVTWNITSRLRVGAQVYDRYIGELGKGRVQLDWALVDYHWKDWLGFRGGKVKTPLGLFNDTQDQEFLHTWALLPQSVYPLDLREVTNAHLGGDLYGWLPAGGLGSFQYQMYAGSTPSDYRSGFRYGIEDAGFRNLRYETQTTGYDLRWNTPVSGLMLGASQSFSNRDYQGLLMLLTGPQPAKGNSYLMRQTAAYFELARGRWRLNGEYRFSKTLSKAETPIASYRNGQVTPGWFAAVAYRAKKYLELGAYRSQYRYFAVFDQAQVVGTDHIYDWTATVRLDLGANWNIKVEGHFIDGYGNVLSARGFYPRFHPQGFTPHTNMLVVRTGFHF